MAACKRLPFFYPSLVFLLLLLRTVSLLALPGRGLLPLSLPPCLLSTLLPSTYPSSVTTLSSPSTTSPACRPACYSPSLSPCLSTGLPCRHTVFLLYSHRLESAPTSGRAPMKPSRGVPNALCTPFQNRATLIFFS